MNAGEAARLTDLRTAQVAFIESRIASFAAAVEAEPGASPCQPVFAATQARGGLGR